MWDERIEQLGTTYETGVVSVIAPDGFPFSVRVPLKADKDAGCVRFDFDAVGVPVYPGLACVAAHDHSPDFKWQRNFQVRGDLVEEDDGSWSVIPRKLIGGFELPPGGLVARTRLNMKKMRRYRKIAKRELALRGR